MKTRFINFLSLFLLMLVTGVFWGTWFTLTRSIEEFSGEEFIHIGKVIIANVAFPMRIIMPSCILFLGLSVVFYQPKKTTGFYFALDAFILIILTLLVTLLVLVPIDNQINEWTAATIPAGWEAIRERWSRFHTIRTFTSLAAFACFSLALLYVRNDKPI